MTNETLTDKFIKLEFYENDNLIIKDVKVNDIEVENISNKDDKDRDRIKLKIKKLDINFILADKENIE
jgi:hypothetical protein